MNIKIIVLWNVRPQKGPPRLEGAGLSETFRTLHHATWESHHRKILNLLGQIVRSHSNH
jgi:hypothetical protein